MKKNNTGDDNSGGGGGNNPPVKPVKDIYVAGKSNNSSGNGVALYRKNGMGTGFIFRSYRWWHIG